MKEKDMVFRALAIAANLQSMDGEEGEDDDGIRLDDRIVEDIGIELEEAREVLEGLLRRVLPDIPASVETVAELIKWVESLSRA